jgi:hypothetical protein
MSQKNWTNFAGISFLGAYNFKTGQCILMVALSAGAQTKPKGQFEKRPSAQAGSVKYKCLLLS